MQVEKVTYEINWAAFKRGRSFFIPCLRGKLGRRTIKKEARRLHYTVVAKIVIEDGVRGVRTWRV